MSLAGPVLFLFSFWQTLFPLAEELAGKAPTYEGQPARYWLHQLDRGDAEDQFLALRAVYFLKVDSRPVMSIIRQHEWHVWWQRPHSHLEQLGLVHYIRRESGADLQEFHEEVRKLLRHPHLDQRSAGLELLMNFKADELRPFRPWLLQHLPKATDGERTLLCKLVPRLPFDPTADAALLKKLLQDPNPQVRLAGLSVLRRRPLRQENARLITPLLNDRDAQVRTTALELLCVYAGEDKADLSYLVQGLSHAEWRVREVSLKRLMAMGPKAKACLPALLAGLSKARAEKNVHMVCAVLHLDPDSDQAWSVLSFFCKQPGAEVRDQMLNRLADWVQTNPRAQQELRELLTGHKPLDVTQVAEFLDRIGVHAHPSLRELLKHPDRQVRFAAMTALRPLLSKDLEAQRMLLLMCRHAKDAEERCHAALALAAGARHSEAIACLGPMLSEPELPDAARLRVLSACPSFMKDDVESAWYVSHCFRAKDPEVRVMALEVFRHFTVRDPWLLAEVEKALRDPELLVRKEAARVLSQWGPSARRTLPELYRLRLDPDSGVQVTALLAIVALEPHPPVIDVLPYLQHQREDVRETALLALGKCGPAVRHFLPRLLDGAEHQSLARTLPLLRALSEAGLNDDRIFRLLLKAWDEGRNLARDFVAVEEAGHILGRYEQLPPFVLDRLQYHLFHGRGFRRLYAAYLLQKHQSSPLALAVLSNSLEDQMGYCGWLAVRLLRDCRPDAKRAVPGLLRFLHKNLYSDHEDLVHVPVALWRMDRHPEAVPALLFMLENGPHAQLVCEALAEIGPDARAALPVLRARLQPPHDPTHRPHLLKALRAIEGGK
jgi:HEAT repeat protein